MKNIVIVGATGSIGNRVRQILNQNNHNKLTLVSRHITSDVLKTNEQVYRADATNIQKMSDLMIGKDAVFVSVSGQLDKIAKTVIAAMKKQDVSRLIFVTAMGIYNEIPASVGSSGNLEVNPFLQTYRNAADIVESSGLNYTILRPGWFDNGSEVYEISFKGEPFKSHDISMYALAKLSADLLQSESLYSNQNIGISRPL